MKNDKDLEVLGRVMAQMGLASCAKCRFEAERKDYLRFCRRPWPEMSDSCTMNANFRYFQPKRTET